MKSFVIPVRDLDAAGRDFEFEVRRDWLEEALAGSDLRYVSDGAVRVRVSMSGRDALVRGSVDADLDAACVRCLEKARVPVRARIERLYAAPAEAKVGRGPRRGAAQERDPEAEVPEDTDTYDGETVVLDEGIREQILLEVPMNPVCRDDCPGLLSAEAPPARSGPFTALASIVLPKKE